MPNTPRVNFDFQNNNVQASVPLLGVSHVVARTTRGKFNDPSELITSWAQFQRIFGDEIVPDGSISNIKKALEIGSKVRVSRVEGASGATYGYAKPYPEGEENANLVFVLTNPKNNKETITVTLNIKTQEQGSPVVDSTGYNLNRNFYIQISKSNGPTTRVTLTQLIGFSGEGNDKVATSDILASNLLFSGSAKDAANPFIEAQVLQDFVNNTPYIQLEVVSIANTLMNGESDESFNTRMKNMGIDGVLTIFREHQDWSGQVKVDSTVIDSSNPSVNLVINEGTNGGDSDVKTWLTAYEATKDYNESYQLIFSHVHQHLPNYYVDVYAGVSDDVVKNFEEVLYVEVPKYNADGTIATREEVINQLTYMIGVIGYAKNIAYFVGGIKYYDDNGALQNNDLLGSVIGLGDVSASNYGPWYSFSGMNRGVISDALGPVMENLGAPSRVEDLQEIAEWYGNLFVIKDTRTQGKRTMLWHGFTSNPKNDSEKFLSIVRLNLYIKKNLRPILESYIEEPNTWDTWKKIYLEGKEIMDDLKDNNALTSYQWLGDQDAQSYSDLQVNNEADVRQGKYKIILKYKDIVPMQEITIVVAIDAVSKEISITAED